MRDSAGSSGGHLPIPPLIDAFRHARNRTGATKISLSSKFGRRKVIHRTVLAAPVPNALRDSSRGIQGQCGQLNRPSAFPLPTTADILG